LGISAVTCELIVSVALSAKEEREGRRGVGTSKGDGMGEKGDGKEGEGNFAPSKGECNKHWRPNG